MDLRQAKVQDLNTIHTIDKTKEADEERFQFIRKSVLNGNAYIAIIENHILGYSVLEHSFFNRGFISMLMVDTNYRRTGIGSALVHHVERFCQSGRIFTSTNQSNQQMQALLNKLGYKKSGVVYDLDPDDPELFFSKEIRIDDKNVK